MIIVNHLVMGEREHESLVHVKDKKNEVDILFDENSMTYGKYPDLFCSEHGFFRHQSHAQAAGHHEQQEGYPKTMVTETGH